MGSVRKQTLFLPSSIPKNVKYSGELWIDDNGTNFKFHIMGGNFISAREALIKFIECLQTKLTDEERCPYYESAECDGPFECSN